MKSLVMKKFLSYVVCICLVVTLVNSISVNAQDIGDEYEQQAVSQSSDYNYARALQMSMYFYDANKCGEGITGGDLDWRGDCHLCDKKVPLGSVEDGGGAKMSPDYINRYRDIFDPDNDGYMDLCGGFHDAGDHVKFGLPQSYSGSTLGWGYYEFRDSYINIGAQEHVEDILRWFNDYFLKCTFRDTNGDVIAFCYQVGEGSTDHNYWGPPELQKTARPALFATPEQAASDQTAGAAASLAINYLNFKDTDPAYAEKCLDYAKALYEFSVKYRGLGASGGFYSSSYDDDELSWAAVWLYVCTEDWSYINDIISVDANGIYTGYLKKIISTTANTWQNIWVHSWDTVWGGVFAKLAPITNDKNHWYFFRWNLEFWSGVPHVDPADTSFLGATPGGFAVRNTWGSARYNTAAQLCALVYNKYKADSRFTDWAKSQMDYILGDNPLNRCYMVGFAENSAKNPHHRAAHSSTTNSMLDPVEQRHVLIGALVGGPDTDDQHSDVTTDYVYNEVAIDYNAAFVGALAGIYELYGEGDLPDPSIPVPSDPEEAIYASCKLEQENVDRTQVTITVHNESFLPAQYENNMKVRYFFDISEMVAAGQSINDLHVDMIYDQAKVSDGIYTKVSDPILYDEDKHIYYIEIDWTGLDLHGHRDIQIAFVAKHDSMWTAHWNPANDWSRQGLVDENLKTEYIPVYLGDELVYGKEPSSLYQNVKVNISSPQDGDVFDYTESLDAIEITADVEDDGNEIDKVEFYADNVLISTDNEFPYTAQYVPDSTGIDTDGKKIITLTAKCYPSMGGCIKSIPVVINAQFAPFTGVKTEIISPKNNEVFDTTAEEYLTIKARAVGDTDDVRFIKLYVDGELYSVNEGSELTSKYYPVDDPKVDKNGISNVLVYAESIMDDGSIIKSDVVTFKAKYPVVSHEYDGLVVRSVASQNTSNNTINDTIELVNTGDKEVDLSKVALRYYFTNDSNKALTFNADYAGLGLNYPPYFVPVTSSISASFETMELPVSNADTYAIISLKNVGYKLAVGQTLKLTYRITNSEWIPFNQSNDYSYNNENGYLIYYDDKLVSGIMP